MCRPPAREEGWMRAPARALAERGWGAFYESAEGGAAGSEIQPYLGDAEGGVDREDSISIGRWAARMGREGG